MGDWLLLVGWLAMAAAWVYIGGRLSRRINQRLSPDHPDPDIPYLDRLRDREEEADD